MKLSRISLRAIFLILLTFSGCGYNTLQSQDEAVKAAWSEVLNQYKRRADLVPNLVQTVSGYASHEKDVLTQVTEARSRVGSITVSPESLEDPAAVQQFADAERTLGSAIGRLLAVAENYPQLKADAVFRDLQTQIEGTENRITVARNRYIQSVQAFNTTVRSFPSNLTAKLFSYQPKANFAVEDEAAIAQPPKVDFSKQ